MANWEVHKPRRALYVDGEMWSDSIRERDSRLSTAPADGIFYFAAYDVLFTFTGQVLNLTSPPPFKVRCWKTASRMELKSCFSTIFVVPVHRR